MTTARAWCNPTLVAASLWAVLGYPCAAWSQPQPGRHPPEAPRAADLAGAAAEGARAFVSARIDRLADMATTDLAPLDDGTEDPNAPPAWPDGASPVETTWEHCDVAGTAEPVDLQAQGMLPTQLAMASRGPRAVALVAMGRPGGDRHGMAFPESRWVEWSDGRVAVQRVRGFFPGATLALRDEGATVLSYVRPDPRTPVERASHVRDVDIPAMVALTQLDAHGGVLHGPNEIETTEGWDIDSRVVPWRFGSAVVLGRATNPPEDRRRHELLHFLDARGHPVRGPLELTDQARDDGPGAPLAGLEAAPDGRTLAASWVVPTGPIAGVWVRRGITLDAQPFIPGTAHIQELPVPPGARRPPQPRWFPRGMWVYRVAQGEGFWGPWVTRGGVVFRRTANPLEHAAPLGEMLFSPWPTSRRVAGAQVLGAWWDPATAWSPGGPITAGLAAPQGLHARSLVVAYTARRERRVRTITVALEGHGAGPSRVPGFEDAADIALCPTDTGALLAWIDGADDTERRLEFVRIACERAR